MAKLNRSRILKAVNESLVTVSIRYSAEYQEFAVKDLTFVNAPATYFTSSLIDAIETAIHIEREVPRS